MSRKIFIIDGENFSTLEEFWQQVEVVFNSFVNELGCFGKNYDAFHDLLCVAPKNSIVIWKNSKLSLERLGHTETIRLLEKTLSICNSSWKDLIECKIKLARLNLGETIFDKLVKIFVEEENIELRLE